MSLALEKKDIFSFDDSRAPPPKDRQIIFMISIIMKAIALSAMILYLKFTEKVPKQVQALRLTVFGTLCYFFGVITYFITFDLPYNSTGELRGLYLSVFFTFFSIVLLIIGVQKALQWNKLYAGWCAATAIISGMVLASVITSINNRG